VPSTDDQSNDAAPFNRPVRELTAAVLLGANAVLLLLGVIDLLFTTQSWAGDFGGRAAATYETFVGLYATVLPLLAVIVVHLRPRLPRARLFTVVALVEYVVSAFFGGLTYIAAFASDMSRADGPGLGQQFENLLRRSVFAVLFALAAYIVFRFWQVHHAGPRAPRLPRTYYGAPTGGQQAPGGYPAQGGYPATTYAPGYAQPGQQYPASTGWPQVPPPPSPTPPYAPTSPPAAETQIVTPQSAPPQPAAPQSGPPQPAAPQSGPPQPAAPQSGPPQPAPPQSAPPQSAPPQAVPTQALPPEAERTQPVPPSDRSEPAGPTITE
jgi:hypothetical protein